MMTKRNQLIVVLMASTVMLNAQIRKLQVESNHSTVGFSIPIAGFTKVTGKFNDYQIKVDWDDAKQIPQKISAVIKVESINTGIKDRDTHLKTVDFFDVNKYPEISFDSDSIKKIDYSHFEATGKLSMHGVTKSIVLPFQIVKIDGNTIGLSSRSTLNRLDYGIASDFKHTSMPDFLSNEIMVEIDFWTKKRKEQ